MQYFRIGVAMFGAGVVLVGLATLVWWLGTDGSAIELANAYFFAGAISGVVGAVWLGLPDGAREKVREWEIDEIGGLRTGWYFIGASAVAALAMLIVMEMGQ